MDNYKVKVALEYFGHSEWTGNFLQIPKYDNDYYYNIIML